jgi:hypothetical protein
LSWLARPVGGGCPGETPVEVFGLVPIPPAGLRDLPGWRASLQAPGEGPSASLAARAIELGHVPLDASDAKVITLTSPVRPRLWLWLGRA